MESIEQTFSDNKGNHLLVALYFYDSDYKQTALHIPDEFTGIEIVDIDIEKAFRDKPIHPVVFFRMSSWLLEQFENHKEAVFSFICSTEDLATNHPDQSPQLYRWNLFDKLYRRLAEGSGINIQDVIVGPDGFQSFGRAFYHDRHASVIHIVASYLQDKQRQSL